MLANDPFIPCERCKGVGYIEKSPEPGDPVIIQTSGGMIAVYPCGQCMLGYNLKSEYAEAYAMLGLSSPVPVAQKKEFFGVVTSVSPMGGVTVQQNDQIDYMVMEFTIKI